METERNQPAGHAIAMEATPSSKKRIKASAALPDEIVEEILARLPARSLRRFRCVSQSWRQLITSPSFRSLHATRAGGGARGRRLFVRRPGYCESFYAAAACGGGSSGADEEILSFSQFAPGNNVFPITKPCHGLVLLRCVEYGAHYVWNPSSGEILTLPDRTPFRTAGRKPRTFVSYGLGYCSATDEHKVVRMYCVGNDDEPHDATVVCCEVFTLDRSTHWRPAATQPPAACRLRVRGSQGAVLCDGNLHFVGKDGVITTFNVEDETFGALMPPPGMEYGGFDLTELDGCLCAYFGTQTYLTPDYPYRVWLLRDRCGWEELRCIDWAAMNDVERATFKSHWIAPLGMYYSDDDEGSDNTQTKKKKKVMFGTGSCKVFVVDPRASKDGGIPAIVFSLDGVQRDGQFATVGLFEESLTPVGRTGDEIIFSSPSAEAWCQVLSRLPARTVGRLNQVCKDWRAMIKSNFLVDSHLLYQENLGDKSLHLMFTDGRPNNFKPLENFIGTLDVPPLVDDDDGSRVVCSKPCRGLNAGSFLCYDFVCNPITGYYKALPLGDDYDGELRGASVYSDIARRSSSSLGRNGGGVDDMFTTGRFGLGYDTEMDMHVLVRMAYKERNFTTREYKLECEIRYVEYMFWEELDPPQRPVADTPPAYVNGKLYWMADGELGHCRSSSSCHEIVVLDVSAREFEILEGPPRVHEDHDERVSIVELLGQVCMVCSHPRKGTLEIWAMKGSGWWSMECCIDVGRFWPEHSSEVVTPMAIDATDGTILLSTGKALGYYDPNTATMQTIYSLGKHIKNKKFVPILVQESLVNPCDQVF